MTTIPIITLEAAALQAEINRHKQAAKDAAIARDVDGWTREWEAMWTAQGKLNALVNGNGKDTPK